MADPTVTAVQAPRLARHFVFAYCCRPSCRVQRWLRNSRWSRAPHDRRALSLAAERRPQSFSETHSGFGAELEPRPWPMFCFCLTCSKDPTYLFLAFDIFLCRGTRCTSLVFSFSNFWKRESFCFCLASLSFVMLIENIGRFRGHGKKKTNPNRENQWVENAAQHLMYVACRSAGRRALTGLAGHCSQTAKEPRLKGVRGDLYLMGSDE